MVEPWCGPRRSRQVASLSAGRDSHLRAFLAKERLFRNFLCQLGDAGGARVRRAVLALGNGEEPREAHWEPRGTARTAANTPPRPGRVREARNRSEPNPRRPLRDLEPKGYGEKTPKGPSARNLL